MDDKTRNDGKPAPDVVRDGLRAAIIAGELEEGSPLRQDEIAERFGTSRIPVREALRQLESEGLVSFQRNKGVIVRGFSIDDVLEMLEIRIALECRALKLAIPDMAVEDFDAAEAILNEYDQSPDHSKWGELNWRFHWALYLPCQRSKLLALIESNYGHVSRYTRRQVSMATGKAKPQSDHVELLELCRSGDVSAAVSLLERHIEQTQRSLRASMRRMEPAR
ncbi:GntR family transcriptional regulator [Agrobacterium tumefaciens]|uniref:GntR family transcriptional regulator n=1 Tax=Agrobacterium tumefaciens TaxID=358 RepID=UPI0015732B17|nr:GntR family transcriptional regulator [Agrobacterium tumefaciens]NTA83780.1 GntR family transcriptional regulator [Agrobacterium tumefaciens]